MIKESPLVKPVNVKVPRLAFLGVGWIGKNRLDAIAESSAAEIAFIAEPAQPVREQLSARYNWARFGSSIEDIIDMDDIDGVVIATPGTLHAEQTIKLLQEGFAVFCQKPLGRNAVETEKVVNTARISNKLLGVDFSYRYTKAFQVLYDVIKSGDIGHVFAVDLVFHNSYGPDKEWFYNKERSVGGCLIDLGIHLLDLAFYTLDFPVVISTDAKLYSKGERLRSDTGIEDYAAALIGLEDGASICLNCSWNLSAGCDAVIEASFHGTKGGISLKNQGGSFYDFRTELYRGTKKDILVMPPDNWGGRAAVNWVEKLSRDDSFDAVANEYVYTSRILDKLYRIK